MQIAMSSPSVAHTYGNVTCFIVEYIKSLFPDYFKSVHVSSSIAYRQMSKINLNNNPKFIKKRKPILIIRPRIDFDNDDDMFLGGTYLTKRMTDLYMESGGTNLQPFFKDDVNGVEIKFLLNRLKMTFDVTIIVETQIEQINTGVYFKNRISQNLPFFLNTNLESQIPRQMMEVFSNQCNVPIYDSNGSVSPFLKYINGKSNYPITYKMKTSTGNDEFFRYYPVNLLASFNGLDIPEGNKKGQVFDYFTINFNVPVEFNTAGLYYYFTQDESSYMRLIRMFDKSLLDNPKCTMVPMFTITNLFNIPIPDGWTLYGTSIFKVNKEQGEVDEVDLTVLHNETMLNFIDYNLEKGIPISPFIQVHLMKDNIILTKDVDYTLSDDTRTLYLTNLNPSSSYRVIIHSNTYYINEKMKETHNLE